LYCFSDTAAKPQIQLAKALHCLPKNCEAINGKWHSSKHCRNWAWDRHGQTLKISVLKFGLFESVWP